MSNNPSPPPLRVVAQSVEDPTHFTESMTIGALVETLNRALTLRRVFVQVQHPEGSITLQPVGNLAITFVRDLQEASPESGSPTPSEETLSSPLPSKREVEVAEIEASPEESLGSRFSHFWGLTGDKKQA